MRTRYSPDAIFNADESAIFFIVTPDNSLKYKNEKCVGGKLSREWVTVLVAANMIK